MAPVKTNTVQFRKGFTKPTMRTTVVLAMWAWANDIEFAVEVKMRNGLRADMVFPELTGSQVVEIMDTETNASLKSKQELYHKAGIECVGVPANDPPAAIAIIKKANGMPQ